MELFDVREAAEHLGVSQQRIRQLCGEHRLGTEFGKVGNQWIITRAELEAFMSSPNRDRRKRQEEAADG